MGTPEETVSSAGWMYPDGTQRDGRWKESATIPFPSLDATSTHEIRMWSINDILISGNAGTGKSTLIELLLLHVLQNANPDEVRIILFDAAGVGFSRFVGMPHLLTKPISDSAKLLNALEWLNAEINRRYALLVEHGKKNWADFTAPSNVDVEEPNEEIVNSEILFFIDDVPLGSEVQLSDVWFALEQILSRGSKVGVVLVMAASLGTVKAMPPSICQVFETRISLRTSTSSDSHLIVGVKGAETLLAPGQALFLQAADGGAHTFSFDDIDQSLERNLLHHWKSQVSEVAFVETSTAASAKRVTADYDDLVKSAIDIVVRSGIGSASLLQRKLAVGFARAGRLMDELEKLGVVGPIQPSGRRDVLVEVDDLDLYFR